MVKIRKYLTVARVSVSNELAYRANMYASFAFYTLFIYIFMGLWKAIYAEGNVQGYTYTQMVWYLIMTEFITFSNGSGIFTAMSDEVKSGAVAYQLGRPVHFVFFQFANAAGQMIPKFIGFGLLGAALGFIFVGSLTTFNPAGIIPLIISVALGVVLNYFFLMLLGLSAFVMEDNRALFLIYQKINFLLGVFLPVEFLPEWLQNIAVNLPFSYAYWAPAKIFVDYSPELFWRLASRQFLWAAVAVALTVAAYNAAVKRLQVNGG